MATPKGKILFSDNESTQEINNQYQPKILFKDEEQHKIPETTTGWSGIGQDIMHGIEGIPHAIEAIPEEVKGIKQQYHNEPSRIGKNILSGIGEAGIGLLNTPYEALHYLGQKELIPNWLKKYNELPFTHIPNLEIEEKIGLGSQKPGDTLLKLIPQLIGGYGVKKFIGPASLGTLEKELVKRNNLIEQTGVVHKQFLGEGQEHAARASQQFLDAIEGKINPETSKREGGLRKHVGSQYDKLTEDLAKENVQIAQTPDLKAIQKSLAKLGKGVSGQEKEKLLKIMTQADSRLHTVNGADALTAYRELKRQKSKALQSAYEPGIGPKEHSEWIKKSEHLSDLEKRMKIMLENQIGGKYLERLKNIDKQYATQIAPLSENSMYQEMLKHGQTSKHIMKYLNGKTAGNETLNSIVANNPELQRVIVGQKFASNPEKLVQQNELLHKYKDMNPIISKIISEQHQIKHTKENIIPELIETIKKMQQKKISKRAFRKGLAIAGTGLGATYLLGNDVKKDLPVIAAMRTLFGKNK